ncbi:helix-turn-helix domain-containing protein [uncultured Winogradskyella sp.]|uniref:helix-turn-helix domain-containing protein n=1 Tax=uncultured Winogradskyella sp. TaxID=395353 RepID=UPI00262742B3|nr:helix-turn-helix domain-containing protein [uncultured Winogradskyella sp.]
MEIIRYILFTQVFIAFFVAGGVFFKARTLRITTLSLLIALVGFHILLFLYGSGSLSLLYPEFRSWFYYEVAFLFGPLLFVHLQCLIQNKQKLRFIDALHLLPILIFWIGYGDVLLMEGKLRGEYINENFINRTMLWNYFLVFQMVIYAIGCSFLLYLKRFELTKKQQNYSLFMVLAYVCSTILISYLTHFANNWRDFASYYLILTLLIFGVGYLLFKNPDFLKQIRKKYFGSNLSVKDMQRITSKIETAFTEDLLFLDSGLSISKLGKILDEKPHHVSQTFSEYVSESFNDYLNKHRVEIAKKYLHDSAYSNFKIEAIALESGFNNKVTFYKAFTKFSNQTPSAFRKQKKSE